MYRELMVVLFAIAAGFTASGIVSNLYRLLARKQSSLAGRTAYIAVMVIAGPNVLLETAATTLKAHGCSRLAFGLAAAVCTYWSFAIGLLVLNIAIVL